MNRSRLVSLCLAFSAVLLFGTMAPGARGAQQRTWTVLAGGTPRDAVLWSNEYHPRSIEIGVGDTVTWKFGAIHTVTFLGGEPYPDIFVPEGQRMFGNPRVFFPVGGNTYDGVGYRNSGAPPDGQMKGEVYTPAPFSYSLTFTKPGLYRYVCVLHGPGMGGSVRVKEQAAGSPAAVLKEARQEQQATLSAGRTAFINLQPEVEGKSVTVPLIGNLKSGYSVLRFTREPLVISRGTTVTWAMRDPFEIHTVTFSGREPPPPFIIPQPQSGGPPKLLFNPKVMTPTKTTTYSGQGYVNSGILFPPGAPGNPPASYQLTFTKSGRYEYWCIVHVPERMKGVVIVK